jgi:uncharacterized protein YjlB
MDIQPAQTIRVEAHRLAAAEGFPNNPKLPLLVYRQALRGSSADSGGDVQGLFESHGWGGSWQNGIFDYHHYHSNTHEVLGVCAGRGRVQFGGPSGPVVEVEAGDVAILPAGTGHKCVDASGEFLVVGAYPGGHGGYDELRGDPGEQAAAAERIAAMPLPEADPVYGSNGPLFEHWTSG